MIPTTPREQTVPALLADRYELGERLGRGSSATVYAAVDRRFGRSVTIKVFDPEVALEPGLRARFQQQVVKAARLQHPSIAAILDAGLAEQPGEPPKLFVVTEPAGSCTLRTLINRRGRLSPRQAVRLVRQLASALAHAHRQGLIHADVKPENVIVDERGSRAILVDFSLSFVSARTGVVTRETIARRAAYLAPEQVRAEPVTPRTDVYGLGVLLYELIVGRPPFVGSTPEATAERRVYEQARPASMFEPSIPPALEGVLGRALEREPDRRFASADTFDAALSRLDSADLEPRETTAPEPEDTRRRRWRPSIWRAIGPVVPLVGAAIALLLGINIVRPVLEGLPSFPTEAAKTSAPEITGKNVVEAQLIAEQQGLGFTVAEERASDRVPRDVVIEQEPTPGYPVEPGQTLKVVVSMGVSIPDVRGKSLENAQAQLSRLGWKIARIDRAPTPGQPAGTVVMQHPAPGEHADGPGEIAVVVAE